MYDPTIGRFLSEDPIGFAGDSSNVYRYVGNAATMYVDPSGLKGPDGPTMEEEIAYMRMLEQQHYAEGADRRKLLELCNGDPKCIEKVNKILAALDNTHIWPIGTGRCHAWADEFKKQCRLQGIPNNEIQHEEPLCDWIYYNPFWEAHSVIIISINGHDVYFDRQLQGGDDHIAFEPHPGLIYPTDPRYNEYWREKYRKQAAWEKLLEKQQRNNPSGFTPYN